MERNVESVADRKKRLKAARKPVFPVCDYSNARPEGCVHLLEELHATLVEPHQEHEGLARLLCCMRFSVCTCDHTHVLNKPCPRCN